MQLSSWTRRYGQAGIAVWGVILAAILTTANTFGQTCQSCQPAASVPAYASAQPSVTYAATSCPQVTYNRCGQVVTRVVYTQPGRGRRANRQTVVYRTPTYYSQATCSQVVQVPSNTCPQTIVQNPVPTPASSVASSVPCPCNAAAVATQAPPCASVGSVRVLPDGTVVQQSPYSLSGYVIPESQRGQPGQQMFTNCEDSFLACCAAGGLNCMQNYIICAQAFGEPINHTSCPLNEDPNPEDPPESP